MTSSSQRAFSGLLHSVRDLLNFLIFPIYFKWIKTVLSLAPQPAANSDVLCYGSAFTIAINYSLSTWVSGLTRGLFCRSKFLEQKRWDQKRTMLCFATRPPYTSLTLRAVSAAFGVICTCK